MKVYVIPKHVIESSPECLRNKEYIDSLKICPYCNQPIKKNLKNQQNLDI